MYTSRTFIFAIVRSFLSLRSIRYTLSSQNRSRGSILRTATTTPFLLYTEKTLSLSFVTRGIQSNAPRITLSRPPLSFVLSLHAVAGTSTPSLCCVARTRERKRKRREENCLAHTHTHPSPIGPFFLYRCVVLLLYCYRMREAFRSLIASRATHRGVREGMGHSFGAKEPVSLASAKMARTREHTFGFKALV